MNIVQQIEFIIHVNIQPLRQFFLTEKLFVFLEHQTIDYQLKREDTMASIGRRQNIWFL